MSLQEEVDKKAKEIYTESYPMSIGELVSIYENEEIDIHPEFQRFYRWGILQKTKLIESVFLGIPIPPIFVSQREDGVWDVIDGLQRLGTIFEFIGVLKDENGNVLPPLKLLGTDYLPSFEGKMWDNDPESSLTNAQKLFFKRAKLDFNIIKKESDPQAKFELFQRLNMLGSALSSQEFRNCILVMINPIFYRWLKGLANYTPFQNCVSLSERLIKEQYDLELVLRFIAYKNASMIEIKDMKDVGDFLTKNMIKFAEDKTFNYEKEENIFKETFKLLDKALGEDTFKKYHENENRFKGAFLVSPFEVIAIGLATNINKWTSKELEIDIEEKLKIKAKSIWGNQSFIEHSGSGLNVLQRLPTLLPFGKRLFGDVN